METFDWRMAPLSHLAAPTSAAAAYLTALALVPHGLLAGKLDRVVACHNSILMFWSLAMFLGCTWEVIQRLHAEGSEWFFCEHASTRSTGRLFFWSYVYYLSKFYELFDTLLARLNGSSLPFPRLHIFHHSCVLLMAWSWLE